MIGQLWPSQYPFKGRSADLGGYRMHYLDEGKGETVLMVHGNPSWSFYYRLVKAMSAANRCIVPDHIGMGLSDRPGEDLYRYTLKSRIDDLDELMRRVAPAGPVNLVLHDWGGMIGMGWAVRHPERVRSIVAFNTACFRLPVEKKFPGLLKILRGSASGVPIRALRAARRFVLATCVAKRKLSPEAMDAYLAVCDSWRKSLAVHRFVQDIPLAPGDPAWDVVAGIEAKLDAFAETPMLLPWGMMDWVFDDAFLRGWTSRFHKAAVRPFENCGHFLLEDAPEELVPLIRDFVARPVAA